MKKYKIENFTRGWVIGDFEPSLLKTKDFELSICLVEKGYQGEKHIHKIAEEIVFITSGRFRLGEDILETGDIVYISPGDVSGFECLEKGGMTTLKVPCVKGDKYLID